MASVSLGWTDGDKKTEFGHIIKVKKQKYHECGLFYRITYDIEKTSEKKFKTVEFLYYGKTVETPLTYDSERHEIKEIQVYVSEFHPNVPLVLFLDLSGRKKYYKPGRKKIIEYNKNDDSELPYLKNALLEENKKNNGKVIFLKDKQQKENISVSTETFTTQDKSITFKKITYTTKIDTSLKDISMLNFTLSLNCLLTDTKNIDSTALESATGKPYDAVVLYFSTRNAHIDRDTPLFVEFFNDCTVDRFSVKNNIDSGKIEWAQDSYVFNDNEQFHNKLIILQEQLSCTINLLMEKNEPYTKENVMTTVGQSNISIYQPSNISVFDPTNVGLSDYKSFQHTIKPALTDLFKKLKIKGKPLNVISPFKDISRVSQFIRKVESTQGEQEKSLLNLLHTHISLNIKLFLFNKEIPIFRSSGDSRSSLYYDDSKSDVNVFFYNNSGSDTMVDKVPLMVQYSGVYYKPYCRSEYFNKWVDIPGLRGDVNSQLKAKLDEVNKDLNQIDISHTIKTNYGIPNCKGSIKDPDSNFCDRVNVKISEDDRYRKVTHSTVNKFFIGKILHKGIEISFNKDGTCTSNELAVYYHFTDDSFRSPLLISFGSQGQSKHDKWYERSDVEGKVWTLRSETDKYDTEVKLENELGNFKRKFFNPLVVDIEQQKNYEVRFENTTTVSSYQTAEITVGRDQSHSSLISPFLCIKQGLRKYYDQNIENIKNGSNVESGVLFSDYDFELIPQIFKIRLKININGRTKFYIDHKMGRDELLVFFSNVNNDSVTLPLLFFYNDKWYKPESKFDYFNEWSEVTTLSGPLDSGTSQKVKTELEKINLMLNEIDISNTNTSGYGLDQREQFSNKNNESACKRINVKRFKGNCYRKVVHSTVDKSRIGDIYYNGFKINGVNLDQIKQSCNEVVVYYLPCDTTFTNPLAINITSSTENDNFIWYHRNTDGTRWENIDKSQFSSYSTTGAELKKIKFSNPAKVSIKLEQNSTDYETSVSKSDCTDPRKYKSTIVLNTLGSLYTVEIKDFRIYGHNVDVAYQNVQNTSIHEHLSLGSNFSFELVITISGTPIQLYDRFGRAVKQFYTNEDYTRKRNPDVYFYNGDDKLTDTVPILLKIGESFFAPETKESYFKHWKEIFKLNGITGMTPDEDQKDKIKQELFRIFRMLNEIDTTQLGSYGFPYCRSPYYYKNGGFSSKRVDLVKYSNSQYKMLVHHPVNKNLVQSIKPIHKCKFMDHIGIIKSYINEVAIIFEKTQLNQPKLVLLNDKSNLGASTTYGYYYYYDEPGKPFEYRFCNLETGANLMGKLKGEESFFEVELVNEIAPINSMWNVIISQNMILEPGSQSDPETLTCEEKDNAETENGECNDPGPTQSTSPDLRQAHQVSGLYRRNSETIQQDSGASSVHVQKEVPPPSQSPSPELQSSPHPQPPLHQPKSTPPSEPSETPFHQGGSRLPPVPTEPRSISTSIPPEMSQSPVVSTTKPRSGEESLAKLPSSEASSVDNPPTQENQESYGHKSPEVEISDESSTLRGDPSPKGEPNNPESQRTTNELSTPSPGTGGEKSQRKYVETGLDGFDNFMNNAIDYTVENPAVVGGAGGGVATVAGSSYPLYKYVFRCKK